MEHVLAESLARPGWSIVDGQEKGSHSRDGRLLSASSL